MARVYVPVLVIALAATACGPTSTVAPVTPPVTVVLTQAVEIHAPEGWGTYRSDALGFGFAYPPSGTLAAGEGTALATIEFAIDPATNIVREVISVSGDAGADTCASPLAGGWMAEDLSPETIVLNGISFLRQGHSGVAAGTSTVWAAYSTERNGRCVSLGYELSTFDPANLDPTRFPTPPASVSWEDREPVFEQLVATFVWLW